MQYLKDDLRKRILASAVAQFAEKGFQAATMRDIAYDAGISSGNIYRYFENKEALFDSAVGPTYKLASDMGLILEEKIAGGGVTNRNLQKTMTSIEAQAFDVLLNHTAEVIILFDKSEGTKFADLKDNMKRTLSGILRRVYTAELEKLGRTVEDNFIFDVISSAFIEGLYLILKFDGDVEKKKALILAWERICLFNLQKKI